METRQHNSTLAVVGGGLAGLAAAVAAVERGLRVELFEQRPHLGGRAGSFRDPVAGCTIDYCQHAALGCCTNFLDLCRRTGLDTALESHRTLHFISAAGECFDLSPSTWLPAPLHLLPALPHFRLLSFSERLHVCEAMLRLVRWQPTSADDDHSFSVWLRQLRQSKQAVACFWQPIVVSALAESLDRVSLTAARQVFVDGLLAHPHAADIWLPNVPLAELFDRRLGKWLTERGVIVHRHTSVRCLEGSAEGVSELVLADGTRRSFDSVVLALPWRTARSVLAAPLAAALPKLNKLDKIEALPITAVHLWLDRQVVFLRHAMMVERLSQWMFQHDHASLLADPKKPGFYYQIVISGNSVLGYHRQDIMAAVFRDLQVIWPVARDAKVLHWRVVTQPRAVFSMQPGVDQLRAGQTTPVDNLFLAGDWTQTGWPSTMEGAVRSGYRAVEALLRSQRRVEHIEQNDLPRNLLLRWLTR